MRNTIQKKSIEELTLSEQTQLGNLFKRYYPSVQQAFIDQRTKVDNGFDLILIKNGDDILGVNYLKMIKAPSPFSKNNVPVVHFGLAMKDENFKGNIIWKLGTWFARRELGYFFPFVKSIGVSTIVSPKVYENFIKLFPSCYPSPYATKKAEEEVIWLDFLNTFYKDYRKINIEVNKQFCFHYPHIGDDDITEDWDRFYKAKDSKINKMFVEKGIIRFENDRIFKGARHLVVCGFRTPSLIKKRA